MARIVTTFARNEDFEEAFAGLGALGLSHEVIDPGRAYSMVSAGAIVMEEEVRGMLAAAGYHLKNASGWVREMRKPGRVPADEAPVYREDIFGRAAVMILASCSADETRIRTIAHISGNMGPALPYLNAEMPYASYNAAGQSLTYMQGYRLITLYKQRIALAKADHIVDAWRVLESIRRSINDTWARRAEIEPSYMVRRRPDAIEIYSRLPHINCGECGFPTCLAFAMRVHGGYVPLTLCRPVFAGDHASLRDALLEVGAGIVGA